MTASELAPLLTPSKDHVFVLEMEENRTQTASGETQWPKAGLNIRQSANLHKKFGRPKYSV
jgi:hypothetical protein